MKKIIIRIKIMKITRRKKTARKEKKIEIKKAKKRLRDDKWRK